MHKIQQLADEHGSTSDGRRSDPSLLTILTALIADDLGHISQQPQLQLISGKSCASECLTSYTLHYIESS